MIAFEAFATAQLEGLLRLAMATCGDRQLAEDLVQDTLVKVHAKWDRVSAAQDPPAYVRRMLINEHVSWRRRWSRFVPTADAGHSQTSPDPALAAGGRDEMRRLLAGLPPKQQAVLALRYTLAMTDTEIAEVLEVSSGTVRGYASRALATLRTHVETELTGDNR